MRRPIVFCFTLGCREKKEKGSLDLGRKAVSVSCALADKRGERNAHRSPTR